MKYFYVLLLFIISNGLGFAQFNDYKPYRREYIYTPGIYYYARQPSDKNIHYFWSLSRGEISNGDYSRATIKAYVFEYEQYENILFFKSKYSKENLIYDGISEWIFFTKIEKIDSIVFSDYNKITIKGSHIEEENIRTFHEDVEWVNTIREEIVITYNPPKWTLNNNPHYIVNVTEEMIGKEIPKNEYEGKSDSFFVPLASEENKYFVFEFFGRYVIFDFTKFDYYYDEIIISAIYNKAFDKYFIFVDYRDNRGDH